MDIDELRTVQTKERQKDSLQHLRDSFYEDVADYIQELKAERERVAERADDPFSDPEVSRLTDEIETAEDVVEAIYERRVGKVVKLSSFAAADMPVDEEGLTTQERDLFEDLVDRIERNKGRVLDILAGEASPGEVGTEESPHGTVPDESPREVAPDEAPPADHADRPASASRAESAESTDPGTNGAGMLAEAMGDGPDEAELDAGGEGSGPDTDGTDGDVPEPNDQPSEADPTAADPEPNDDPVPEGPPNDPPTPAPADSASDGDDGAPDRDDPSPAEGPADDTERTTVRVTADVGSILGLDDREYDLASEDVVALPAANADALLQQDAAERLE